MINDIVSYSKFLMDSGFTIFDVIKKEYTSSNNGTRTITTNNTLHQRNNIINKNDNQPHRSLDNNLQHFISNENTSNIDKEAITNSYPTEWDLPTKLMVSMLKQILTHEKSSIRRIRNSSKLFWLPVPSDIIITPIKFSYKLQHIMDLERQGRIFKNPLLPDVPFESKIEKTVDIQGEWIYTKENEFSDRVILYVHGGAFFCGNNLTHRMITTKIAREMNARVFVFNYRLAPEHPFPAALHDTFAAYLYLINSLHIVFPVHNKTFHKPISPKDILLMGDSAGGGLCMSLMLYLKDYLKKSSKELQFELPLGASLMSPWVDLTCSSQSWKTNGAHDYLPTSVNDFFCDLFTTDVGNPVQWYTVGPVEQSLSLIQKECGSDYKLKDILSDLDVFKLVCHPLVSPVNGDLKGLPPTMIHVGDAEVLRDESYSLIHKLHQVNPRQTFFYRHHIFYTMPHVFQMLPWVDHAKTSYDYSRVWANALHRGDALCSLEFESNHIVECYSISKNSGENMIPLSSLCNMTRRPSITLLSSNSATFVATGFTPHDTTKKIQSSTLAVNNTTSIPKKNTSNSSSSSSNTFQSGKKTMDTTEPLRNGKKHDKEEHEHQDYSKIILSSLFHSGESLDLSCIDYHPFVI